MSNPPESDAPCSEPANKTPDQTHDQTQFITLKLSLEEGRWLVTATGIALRLLEGLQLSRPEAQWFQIRGVAALHRIANYLPSELKGYYPSSKEFEDDSE